MQCPKCSYENPSGIRYCLNCGTQMIPPVPEEKKPKLRESKKTTLIVITLAMIVLMAVGTGVFIAVISGGSYRSTGAVIAEVDSVESGQTASDPYQEENPVYRFVDFSEQTLKLPDSGLKIKLPDFYDYRFDYDKSKQLLVFEIDTYEEQTITFTSSRLNASPFTKSEAEASSKTGLYYEIAGEEDLYYYILPANGPTANATIIDCRSNSSTNITVYDKNYMLTRRSELNAEESSWEERTESSDSQESVLSEGHDDTQQSSTASGQDQPTERPSSTPSASKRAWQGSQAALDLLEELLESTGIAS